MVRDQNKDEMYFTALIEFTDKKIHDDMPTTESFPLPKGRAIVSYSMIRYCSKNLICRYSRGDRIESLKPSLMLWIQALEIHRRVLKGLPPEFDNIRTMYQRVDLDTVFDAQTMLAVGAALKLKLEDMQRLISAIGEPGKDALMDEAAKALGDTNRSVADECKYPKVYAPLLEIWRSPTDQRTALIAKYAKQWIRKIKPIFWSDFLEGAEDAYFGYWCFDIALAVIVLNIDDHQLRDNPYYPKDLVDFARGRSTD